MWGTLVDKRPYFIFVVRELRKHVTILEREIAEMEQGLICGPMPDGQISSSVGKL